MTGRLGAVDFDKGYIRVGHGPTTVDLYLDMQCSTCGEVDATLGSTLVSDEDADRITFRVHPVAFMGGGGAASREHSTRAAAALTAVAAYQPRMVLPFMTALLAHQSTTHSAEIDDTTLAQIARGAGVRVGGWFTDPRFGEWVSKITQAALAPSFGTQDRAPIVAVPAVFVDGERLDGARLQEFVRRNGGHEQ